MVYQLRRHAGTMKNKLQVKELIAAKQAADRKISIMEYMNQAVRGRKPPKKAVV